MESNNLKLCNANKLHTGSFLITKTGSILGCGECTLPIFFGSYAVDSSTTFSKKIILFYSNLLHTNFF